jgi:hypothetical protein
MDQHYATFVELLASMSPDLEAARIETIDWWQPDEPPSTAMLAALGHRIAEKLGCLDLDTTQRIFSLVEDGVASGSDSLATAVASGFLEALAGDAVRQPGLWDRVSPLLGPRSLQHAQSWIAPC